MNETELNAIYARKTESNAILIHCSQLNPGVVSRVIQECSSSDSWHKFMVGNVETLPRDLILKTITNFVYPSDFLPVCFSKRKRAFFLVRNCVEAILKLISNKLLIPHPRIPNQFIRITIIANQIPSSIVNIDISTNLQAVLKKRFQGKCINLSNFHSDAGLTEFCVLSQPKLMLYVMQFVSELKPPPTKLIFSDNFLRSLEAINVLGTDEVRSIDLRNNELATKEALEPLKSFTSLEIIKLDGNPLCNLYNTYEYISIIQQLCPNIKMIDNLDVFQKKGIYTTRKNFLCDLSGGDLVNQFIEYFFTAYDLEDRTKMVDLYHKNAIFSTTCTIITNQKTTSTARLNHYLAINRNIRSPTHCFSSKDKFLYRGSANIMKLFKELPRTVHDPLSLQCDLVHFSNIMAVLVVHGIFQEKSEKLSFTRSFVLQHDGNNAYSIVNEQLHIYNTLTCQLKLCYKFPPSVEYSFNPLPYYNRQFWELREAVREVTLLNYDYSQRLLEICHYDLKSTLNNFIQLHINNQIPPEAFIEPRTDPMLDPQSKKKPALPTDVQEKTTLKFDMLTLHTAWMTVNEERLHARLNVTDSSISKLSQLLNNPETFMEKKAELSAEQMRLFSEVMHGATRSGSVSDNQIPGTSKGDTLEVSGPSSQNVEPSDEPVAAFIKKLNMFKEQRKQALMFKKKSRGQPVEPLPQALENTPLDPNAYLKMFENPQELGIGTNKVVTEVVVKTLANGKRFNKAVKRKISKIRKKKGMANSCNINVIKQQYFFTQ